MDMLGIERKRRSPAHPFIGQPAAVDPGLGPPTVEINAPLYRERVRRLPAAAR